MQTRPGRQAAIYIRTISQVALLNESQLSRMQTQAYTSGFFALRHLMCVVPNM